MSSPRSPSPASARHSAAVSRCQYWVGIQIGRRYWPATGGAFTVVDFTGNAQISGTQVSGYQKNGITADGPDTKILVQDCTIGGGGQTSQIAQNGIQVSRGATAQVHGNLVDQNEYAGPGSFASATDVLVFGGCGDPLSANIDVRDNTFDGQATNPPY